MGGRRTGRFLWALGVLLVVADQVIKYFVKTRMCLHESFEVFPGHSWFQILFVENEGMAYGIGNGGGIGIFKLLLSVFRIALAAFLVWWIGRLVRRNRDLAAGGKESGLLPKGTLSSGRVPTGVLVGLTLITAGAVGNIIDCLCYGRIFSASTPETVAVLGGSYAPVLFGKVVDMFYFPLIDTHWPTWLPWIGGRHFIFFSPVFNFADSCVTVGAIYLILFQYRFFASEDKKDAETK